MHCAIPIIEYAQAQKLKQNDQMKSSSNSENILYDINKNNNMYPMYNNTSPVQQRINIMSHDLSSPSLSLSSSPQGYDSSEKASNESAHDLSQSFGDNGVFDTSLNDDFGKKKKRINRFFTPSAVGVLKKWFYEHDEYPYPDDNMTTMLAKEANISTKQVRKWFANKRVRSNKCYKQIYRSKRKSSTTEDGEVSPKSSQKLINSTSLFAFQGEACDQSNHSNIPKSESLPNIDAMQFNNEISRVMFGLQNLPTVSSNPNLYYNNDENNKYENKHQDQQQHTTNEQNPNFNALVAYFLYSNMIEFQKQYAFANQAWANVINKNVFNEFLNAQQQHASQTGSPFQAKQNSNRKHNSTSTSSTATTATTLSSSSSPLSHNDNNNTNNDDFDCTDYMFETDNRNNNKSNDNIIIDNYNKNSSSSSSTPSTSSCSSKSSILTSSPILNTIMTTASRASGVSTNNNTDVSVKKQHDSPIKQQLSINKCSTTKNQKSKVNFGDVSDLIN